MNKKLNVFWIVLIFICLSMQTYAVNLNISAIDELNAELTGLKARIEKLEQIRVEMTDYDVVLTKALNNFKSQYKVDLEQQSIYNHNFITKEQLQLEVQRVVELNREVEDD